MSNKETYRVDQMTASAGLIIKTQVVKRNILAYMKRQNHMNFNPKLEEGDKDKCYIQISGGHVAIAAAVQELLKMLIEVTVKNIDVDKTGLKNVCRKDMSLAVNNNVALNNYYFQKTIRYFESNDADYMAQMPVDEENVNYLLSTLDSKLCLTSKCLNFLAFLVSQAYVDILRFCTHLMRYRKQNSLREDTVVVAIEMLFLGGITDRLKTAINTAVSKLEASGAKDEDDDGAAKEDEADENEAAPVAQTKSKSAPAQAPAVVDNEDDELADDEPAQTPKGKGKTTTPTADDAEPKTAAAKSGVKPKTVVIKQKDVVATANSNEKKAPAKAKAAK